MQKKKKKLFTSDKLAMFCFVSFETNSEIFTPIELSRVQPKVKIREEQWKENSAGISHLLGSSETSI